MATATTEALKGTPKPDEKIESAQRDFITTARERYQKGVDEEQENRDDALEDLEFYAGEQWPEEIRRERIEDGRPILTINRMPQYVRQVTGDIRQNKPAIKVRPADDVSDEEVADVYSGLIRHIEQISDAQNAYMTAVDGAAQAGMGHFRIVTEYSDEDTFEQDIRIRRIKDHFGVVWDPQAVLPTYEDARYCFVEENMDIETFKARYPNAQTTGFDFQDQATYAYLGDWITHETVRVAEYWTKELEKKLLALLDDGRTVDVTQFKDVAREGLVIGEGAFARQITRLREVQAPKIQMHTISGSEVLEGPFDWAGRYIPVIPVLGEEVYIGRKTIRFGVTRHAKDAQRMYNYWRSAQTEQIALQPKAPYTVTVKNIAGMEDLWAQANTRNLPYLPYTPDEANAGQSPQRTIPPLRSEGMAAEVQLAGEDMKATTGMYDAAVGQRSNETSGKAIIERKRESDVGTYIYPDNLNRAIRWAGMQLVDLIPRIYDTPRVVRILNEDDSAETVPINQRVFGPDEQEIILNDLAAGKYDVVVTAGPSYSTKRVEAADGMIQLMQAVPKAAEIMMDLLVENLDWPGADRIAERLRKVLPPGLEEPKEGEEPVEPPPPNPEQVAELQKAENEKAKTMADVAAKEAETEGQRLENAEKAWELALKSGELDALIERQIAEILTGMLTRSTAPAGALPVPPTGVPMQ